MLDFLENKALLLPPMMNATLVSKVEQNIAWMTSHQVELQDWLQRANSQQGQGRRRRSVLSDLLRDLDLEPAEGESVQPGTNLQNALASRKAIDDLMWKDPDLEEDKDPDLEEEDTEEEERIYRVLPHNL